MKYLLSILVLLITYRSTANQCGTMGTIYGRVIRISNICTQKRLNGKALFSYLSEFDKTYLKEGDLLILSFSDYVLSTHPTNTRPQYLVGYANIKIPKVGVTEEKNALIIKVPTKIDNIKEILNIIYYAYEHKDLVVKDQKARFFLRDHVNGEEDDDLFLYGKYGQAQYRGYRYVQSLKQRVIGSIRQVEIPYVNQLLTKKAYYPGNVGNVKGPISMYFANDSIYFYKGDDRSEFLESDGSYYYKLKDSSHREQVLLSLPYFTQTIKTEDRSCALAFVDKHKFYLCDFLKEKVSGPFLLPDLREEYELFLFPEGLGRPAYGDAIFDRVRNVITFTTFSFGVHPRKNTLQYNLRNGCISVDSAQNPELVQHLNLLGKDVSPDRCNAVITYSDYENQMRRWPLWFKVCTILTTVVVGGTGTYILLRKQ